MSSINYNSISDIMAYFMGLQKYSTTILTKINEAITTEEDLVVVPVERDDGLIFNYKIPSFKNIEKKIKEIDRQFRSLYLKESYTNVDGKELVKGPSPIGELDVPVEFFSKPNYMFENLLNPLLYIKINVAKYVSPSDTHLIVRRVILDVDTEEKKSFFNKWFDKRKDLDFSYVEEKLISEGIGYTFDEELLSLPPVKLKQSGAFGIIKIGSELASSSTYSTVREYVFDSLNYQELVGTSYLTKVLKEGDLLVTNNGNTFYRIVSVKQDTFTVTLGLENGYDVVPIGSNVLSLASVLDGNKDFHITIGNNEYQLVFLKPVDNTKHITTTVWSKGFAFKTEDLYIQTDEGKILFSRYYTDSVQDFSKLFIGLLNEHAIPSIFVIKPNAPVIREENFQVHILNDQIRDSNKIFRQKSLIESRELLEDKKIELTTSISADWAEIQENTELTEEERDALLAQIETKTLQKEQVIEELRVLRSDIIQENKNLIDGTLDKLKAVIDGAWISPSPKYLDITGYQHPTHFRIKVTYLDKYNKSPQNLLINIKRENDTIEPCYVPNFKIYETYRRKWIEDASGEMVPEPLDLSNSTTRSINQLPVPIPIDISSGEKVQIEVQTCVETFGVPTDNSYSDWSNPVIISVPEEMRVSLNQDIVIWDKIAYYARLDERNIELDQLVYDQELIRNEINAIKASASFGSSGTSGNSGSSGVSNVLTVYDNGTSGNINGNNGDWFNVSVGTNIALSFSNISTGTFKYICIKNTDLYSAIDVTLPVSRVGGDSPISIPADTYVKFDIFYDGATYFLKCTEL